MSNSKTKYGNYSYPDYAVPERTLAHRGCERGKLSTLRLEEVRDHLVKLERLTQPEDVTSSLSRLHVNIARRPVQAWWTTTTGSEPLLFTRTGLSQMASTVLPSRFYPGLRKLAELDVHGGDLANSVWEKFASRQVDDVVVRIVSMKLSKQNSSSHPSPSQ